MQLIRSESGVGEYQLTTEEQAHFAVIREVIGREQLGYSGRMYYIDSFSALLVFAGVL